MRIKSTRDKENGEKVKRRVLQVRYNVHVKLYTM